MNRRPHICHATRPLATRHPRPPAYVRIVKIILLCAVAIVCSSFTACASKKSKSRYRNYENDNSPNLRMYTEKPGYPLDTR